MIFLNLIGQFMSFQEHINVFSWINKYIYAQKLHLIFLFLVNWPKIAFFGLLLAIYYIQMSYIIFMQIKN